MSNLHRQFFSFFLPFSSALFSLFFLCFSLLFSVLGWSTSADAQVLRVVENATVKANIADTEMTRIAVDNDRIAVLRGIDGAYTYSNDNNSGAVFLKPSDAYQNRPFYLFINTEQNRNYVLQLKPTPKLSASVLILKSRGQALQTAERWETDSPYGDTLTKLMIDMANHQTPEGYEVIQVNDKKTIKIIKKRKTNTALSQVRMRLKTVYSGAHLQGQIYEITNTSLLPVTWTEHLFYQPGDRAIALRDATVPAGGQTLLYKVNSHG